MSYDPVEDAAAGTVKGFLDWTVDQIKSLAEKFRNREIAFIQDEETIRIVKEQYNSGELNFYKTYIEDKELLFLVKIGMTLRQLERNYDRKQNLRTKIYTKYEAKGLHIAQFVENGILNRYIGILIDNLISIEDFKRKIKSILENIDGHVLFVKTDDRERLVIQTVKTKIFANSPTIFIVSGILSAAEIVRKCEIILTPLLNEYELEKMSSGQKENLFYKKALRTPV